MWTAVLVGMNRTMVGRLGDGWSAEGGVVGARPELRQIGQERLEASTVQ